MISPSRRLGLAATLAWLAVGLAGCTSYRDAPRAPGWDKDRPVYPLLEPEPEPVPVPRLRSYVVLLPKEDGTVGEIDVLQGEETTTLSEAGAGYNFEDPSQVVDASAPEIQAALHAVEQVEPVAPVQFVVYFPSGKTEPTAESRREWPAITAALASHPAAEITVSGHTDSVGPETFNRTLAMERANAMRAALINAGAEAGLITAVSYGESRPAVERPDGQAEPLNRRVVIRIR